MSSNRFSESHSVAHRNREIEKSAVCLISPRIRKNFLSTRILTSDCIVAFLHSKAEFTIYHPSLNHASFSFLYGNKQLRENTFSHKHLTSFCLKLLHRNLENQSCFMNSFTTAILLRNPCLDRL